MNYIKHLNSVFQSFYGEEQLNSTHISLYMALFQFWNLNRFPEVFFINRQEVMQLSKIGSKATYHRCLRQLHNMKYINYLPSHNPLKGSQIKMLIFGTSTEPPINELETSTGQALVPNINFNKHKENSIKTKLPKNENEVISFFEKNNWSELEAKKFYNHYQSIGWKIGGKIKIVNWKASAKNWMLKSNEIETAQEVSQNKDNLKTTNNKNYDQPL